MKGKRKPIKEKKQKKINKEKKLVVVKSILRPYNPHSALYHHQLFENKPAFNAGSIEKVIMVTFEEIWRVLYEHGASSRKEEGTRRYWETLSPEQQERAFTTISSKLKEGKFVQYDPIRAIKEALRSYRKEKEQLTFAEYYARFGTTEEQGGWHMENPTGQQVIYVKNGKLKIEN